MSENQTLDFNSLDQCNEKEINYIKSRWIDYDKVKSIVRGWDYSIKCRICWLNDKWVFDIINIQSRYIDKEWKDRFRTLANHKASWVFIDKIDKWCDILFIVEWMFDFLSLLQYTNNVVWVFNAWSTETIDVINYIISNKNPKKIILIYDNDEAWNEMKYRFQQNINKLWIVDISWFWDIKDANDLIKLDWFSWDDFVAICNNYYDDSIKNSISQVEQEKKDQFEKLKDIKSIYKNWMPIEFPVPLVNAELWKILPNDFSIMIWSPNAWKTTFAFIMMLHNLDKWHKVWFLSYEMDFGDILNQYYLWKIPWAMDRFWEASLTDYDNNKLKEYKEKIFNNPNFYQYSWQKIGIDEMKSDINKLISVGVDFIIIDNLIKIRWTNSEISDNQEIIEELFNIKRNNDIWILLLHHTDKQASIKNLLSYKWTSDVQIKPDNMFYIKRSVLWDSEWLSDDEKCELVIRKAKQRLWKSNAWKECSVYFHNWEYYGLEEFMQKIRVF